MMFLVRSAFWLGLVFSWMPLDRGEALRTAVAAAQAECVTDMVSCRAIVTAASGAVLATSPGHTPVLHVDGKGRPMPSADTLSAADLATPWRGRQRKSGA
jgi:hypothetical protein